MNTPQPQSSLRSRLFDDGEPVVTARPLLQEARTADARVPLFGDVDCWDFNGVLRRPANRAPASYRLNFNGGLESPAWNLLARELLMIMANPTHPAVISAGTGWRGIGAGVPSLQRAQGLLRRMASWGRENAERLIDPAGWRVADLRRFVEDLRDSGISTGGLSNHVRTLQRMATAAPIMTVPWPANDPWPRQSSNQIAKNRSSRDGLATPAVKPNTWFPLIRAAWSYIHDFAPDVLRAHERRQALESAAAHSVAGKTEYLRTWLQDPSNLIPVFPGRVDDQGRPVVSWGTLTLLLGSHPRRLSGLFGTYEPHLRSNRALVMDAVAADRITNHPFTTQMSQVSRSDGSIGPWHPGLFRSDIRFHRYTLRDAAFVLVAALSMMRDSEIAEIERGNIVQYFNSPAIASRHIKGDPNLPRQHWWITEPVAEAIAIAEAVSEHPERVFAPVNRPGRDYSTNGVGMISSFITDVNANLAWTGLDPIPADTVRPHMFRRTMAMLTDQFAGSEIALGMQLKHIATRALANTVTRAYAASDTAWADHLENAIDAARFRRIEELYHQHEQGETIGFGPGAERIKNTFDQVAATARARGGDARVEADLLRRSRITIRFGTLNHCLFDPANPTGAACLENTVVPEGHAGPLHDRCRPDRCPNKIGRAHV